MTIELSKKDFLVLETLDKSASNTQRQIANQTGYSLGQVNYLIKSLLERGLIKVMNFKQSKNKLGYSYLLTRKGLEAKSKATVNFVVLKLKEYHELKQQFANTLIKVDAQGLRKLVFIGPALVNELLHTVIQDQNLSVQIANHLLTNEDFLNIDSSDYDGILFLENSDIKMNHKNVKAFKLLQN